MKNLKIFTLGLMACLLLGSQSVMAVNSAPAKEGLNSEITTAASPKEAKKLHKQELKKQKKSAKIAKKIEKMQDKIARKGVDFDDPVKKWMWFWIFGWGASLVLSILAAALFTSTLGGGFGGAAILWLLASLAGLFGTVSLVIWLVKLNS